MQRIGVRRRILFVLVASALTVTAGAGTQGASGQVIAESKNFRLIDTVTLGGVAVSGRVVGDTYFVSSWQTGLSAYDVSDPKKPEPAKK